MLLPNPGRGTFLSPGHRSCESDGHLESESVLRLDSLIELPHQRKLFKTRYSKNKKKVIKLAVSLSASAVIVAFHAHQCGISLFYVFQLFLLGIPVSTHYAEYPVFDPKPASTYCLISRLCIIFSLILAIKGRSLLHKVCRTGNLRLSGTIQDRNSDRAGFSTDVSRRHPLYGSIILSTAKGRMNLRLP